MLGSGRRVGRVQGFLASRDAIWKLCCSLSGQGYMALGCLGEGSVTWLVPSDSGSLSEGPRPRGPAILLSFQAGSGGGEGRCHMGGKGQGKEMGTKGKVPLEPYRTTAEGGISSFTIEQHDRRQGITSQSHCEHQVK